MIVAFASHDGRTGQAPFAASLAHQRARQGKRILLLDADPAPASRGPDTVPPEPHPSAVVTCRAPDDGALRSELDASGAHFDDVMIETSADDVPATRAALISARLAVVLLHVDHTDLDRDYRLVARLNAARMFNPGLHVTFVLVGPARRMGLSALAAARTYAAHVMSATLADTAVRLAAATHVNGPGPSPIAADLACLGRELFPH